MSVGDNMPVNVIFVVKNYNGRPTKHMLIFKNVMTHFDTNYHGYKRETEL